MSVKFSQVFLKDLSAREKIARAVLSLADFSNPKNSLTEIGPGGGALTSIVFPKVPSLKAVEIDKKLAAELSSKYRGLEIINSDFLKIDAQKIFPFAENFYFFGNLPYKISTAIMEKILDTEKFAGAVFMFQKEVADRLTAAPGDKAYGYFSAVCSLQTDIKEILFVPKGCFTPVPKVDSAVVEIKPLKTNLTNDFIRKYRKIVSYAFAHRRKTVENSLYLSLKGDFEREYVSKVLKSAGIDPKSRAETISPELFKNLTSIFNLAKEE